MDLLLHNLRTGGIRHDDWSVAREAADEIERLREALSIAVTAHRVGDEAAEVMRTEADTMRQVHSYAAIAWGWLWHVTTSDDRVKTARHLLGQMLDKDLKRYGIQTAKNEGARVNVHEIEAAMLRGDFGDE